MCLGRYRGVLEIWVIIERAISNDTNNLLSSNNRWKSSIFSLVLTYKNLNNLAFWRDFGSSPCKLARQEGNSPITQEAMTEVLCSFKKLPAPQFGLMPYHPAVCPPVHCPLFWHSCLPVDPYTGPPASPYPVSLHSSHCIPIWSLPGHCQKGPKASLS